MNRFAVNNPHTCHRGIIPGAELIQLITGPADAGGQTHGRYGQRILSHRVVRNVLPQPSKVQQFPHPCMDGAVAHENQGIAFFDLESVFIDFLALHDPYIFRNLHKLSVPDKNASGIIIFHQIRIPIMIYLQYAEGGISHLPDLTDGESLTDGIHTLLQGSPIEEHGSQYLRGQRGQDIGLDSASHTVRQNHNVGILGLQKLYLVPAQDFSVLVQAFICNIHCNSHYLPPLPPGFFKSTLLRWT